MNADRAIYEAAVRARSVARLLESAELQLRDVRLPMCLRERLHDAKLEADELAGKTGRLFDDLTAALEEGRKRGT